MKFRSAWVVCLAVCMPGALVSAAPLYSFEDVTVGSSLGGLGAIVDTGNGITDGGKALRLTNSTGTYDKLGHIILNPLVDSSVPITQFQADWYFEAGPGSAGSYNGLTFGMFNETTSSFLQLDNTVGGYIGSGSGANGQYSVTYNLNGSEQSFVNGALTAGDRLQLGMYSNKDTGSGSVNGTYTIDNLGFDGLRVLGPYPGADPNAAWRTVAASQIDQHRMGDLNYTVTSGGAPVQGAQVDVQMTEHAFGWGTAVSAQKVNNPTNFYATYKQKIPELFNTATVEAAMQWKAWEGDWGSNLAPPNGIDALDWINGQGLAGRGHVHVWPGYQWLPVSIQTKLDEYNAPGTSGGRKNVLRNQMRQDVLDHINAKATAAAGKVEFFDVINEVRANHDLMDILGDDVMVDWFNAAKAADPNAELYLNEYDILSSGGATNSANQQQHADTIQYLIDQGAPIEGIALQSHFLTNSLTGPEQVWAILDRFDDFGLPIQITEFDFETTDEALQAQFTADFMTAVFAHPAIHDFIMWGFWEDSHWRPDAAMYRSDWSIKPNGQAYIDLVLDQWWTDEQAVSDAAGGGSVRGFKGAHGVTVSYQGISQTHHDVEIGDTTNNLQLPLAGSVDGVLNADVFVAVGQMQIAEADNIGTLQLQGVFEQTAFGTLHVELTDTTSDQILADSLILGGTLVVEVIGGALPGVGETFMILSSSSTRIGTFDNVVSSSLLVDVQYFSDHVMLSILGVLALDGDLDGDGFVWFCRDRRPELHPGQLE